MSINSLHVNLAQFSLNSSVFFSGDGVSYKLGDFPTAQLAALLPVVAKENECKEIIFYGNSDYAKQFKREVEQKYAEQYSQNIVIKIR